MTLIITEVSRLGIATAADSALTPQGGGTPRSGAPWESPSPM